MTICGIEWNLTQVLENNNIQNFSLDNNKQYILWNYIPNGWYVLFISDTFYLDSDNYLCSNDFVTIRANPLPQQQYIDICSHTIENGYILLNDDITNLNFQYHALYTSSNVVIYEDNTLTTFLDLSQLNGIIENANDISNITESGGESGGEESSNIFDLISNFFSHFWENIIHIVVPNEEEFEDLQESFNDNILSVFSLTSLSRSSSYSNNDKYPSVNYNDKMPIFNIMGYEFDTTYIKNFLDTPFTFGVLRYQMGETNSDAQVYTGGLTCRHLISLIFAIEICAMNIALYNKFFNKGE